MKNWEHDTIATFHKRQSSAIEQAVEEGIKIFESHGLHPALTFMQINGVPMSVARRVTLAPELRRVVKHK